MNIISTLDYGFVMWNENFLLSFLHDGSYSEHIKYETLNFTKS